MNIKSAKLHDDNIKHFIRAYNQARMHKAKTFPFEGQEIPTKVAFAMLHIITSEKVIYGCFDDNGRFTETVNPQLN